MVGKIFSTEQQVMTRLLAEQNVILSITQDRVCPFFGSLGMQGFGNWQHFRGVPPVASLLDSRLSVNLNDDGLSRHPLEMREVLGEEQDESEWH